MVSNLPLSCVTVHVGVTRRSVMNCGRSVVLAAGVVIMTEMSVGVGWNAMLVQSWRSRRLAG